MSNKKTNVYIYPMVSTVMLIDGLFLDGVVLRLEKRVNTVKREYMIIKESLDLMVIALNKKY